MQLPPILMADDDEGDLAFLRHQFASARILNPLQSVSDGEQTIHYLKGHGKFADREKYPYPVILFLDIRMPRIGGYGVLSFLRANSEHRKLPVIVLSVISDLRNITQAYERGANSFLIKPVRANDIVCTLRATSGLHLDSTEEGFLLTQIEVANNKAPALV